MIELVADTVTVRLLPSFTAPVPPLTERIVGSRLSTEMITELVAWPPSSSVTLTCTVTLAGPSGKLASVTSTSKVQVPPAGEAASVKIGAAAAGAEKLPAQFEDHA